MLPTISRHSCPAVCLGWAMVLWAPLTHAAEPFDYFRNSWSVIGLKDYQDGTRITPMNELLLAGDQRIRLRFGAGLRPLSREQTKTLLDGWLPVVLLTATDGPVRYEFTLWASPLPTVARPREAFDWPSEGENFLNWIVVRLTNTGATPAPGKLQVERIGRTNPQVVLLDSSAWTLEPGQSVRAVTRVPFSPVKDEAAFANQDPDHWLHLTVRWWRNLLARAARIQVPCQKATQALLAAHVCQLIANDHGVLHGGEGFYDEFYIRDGGYQIMELEEAGLSDAARKAVDPYLRHQQPDGRFETQPGQFDANGQALWVLWQFYQITGDRAWLTAAYPQMRRAVDWTIAARRQAPGDSPFAGLLPAAVADGEYLWDGKHHVVGYDFWNLRGLLCTADAAAALDRDAEAKELRAEADKYRADIDAAWKRTGLPHFPPSWEKEGTHWGNTETLWPTELFAPDDPRAAALLGEVRQRHGGGFIEGAIQWRGHAPAIHPYMSAYSTLASLARGEHEQVVEDFYWYLLHSSATHAFPEGIYPARRFAWNHTIPHVTGASNYALMLRHMLIHERGHELHLLAAVPDGWLDQGQEIIVERAPTHFGVMSFRTRGTAAGVEFELQPPARSPPQRIVLHLPRSQPLVGSAPSVEIAIRDPQRQRWDFPTVVKRYLEHAPPLVEHIDELVSLPLSPPLAPNQCRMLDLTPLANTDPLTAPFGVANPGRLVFAGMSVGVQVVGGVPFQIIDPAANQGRGFIVLHSPQAPANRDWPRRVEIPVQDRGQRLFFLGNVHGWGAGDGEQEPIARYVIHYADGGTQAVPLIAGETADDWTVPRQVAMSVFRGLEGDPWHLNVLGVELRDALVDKIVFEDTGTPPAPLLAAVTLEK